MTEPVISIKYAFYDGSTKTELLPPIIQNLPHRIFGVVEKEAAERTRASNNETNIFSSLLHDSDKVYFEYIKANPALYYQIGPNEWRFCLSKDISKYEEFPAVKHAPNEPEALLPTYDLTQYIRSCISNVNNEEIKQFGFTYQKPDNSTVIMVATMFNSIKINGNIYHKEKLDHAFSKYKKQLFSELEKPQGQPGD